MSLLTALLVLPLVLWRGTEASWWNEYSERDLLSQFYRTGDPEKEVKVTVCGEESKGWPLRPRPWTGPSPYGRYGDGAQNLLFSTIAKADQVDKSKIYMRKPNLADEVHDKGFLPGPYMQYLNMALNNQVRRFGVKPYLDSEEDKN